MKKWIKRYFLEVARRVANWHKEQLLSENEKKFRKQSKELQERLRTLRIVEQNKCPHIAGCNFLSEQQDIHGLTSIVWHRTDAGEIIGICTNCQRIFWPKDPDYEIWRKKPSFNKMSGAGYRISRISQEFIDSPKSDPILNSLTFLTGFIPTHEKKSWVEGIGSLSLEEEQRLWKSVQKYRKNGQAEVTVKSDSSGIPECLDPWLLNSDGTPDIFCQVDFGMYPDHIDKLAETVRKDSEATNEQTT